MRTAPLCRTIADFPAFLKEHSAPMRLHLIFVIFCAAAATFAIPAQAQDILSSGAEAWLRDTILTGRSDLRWPDFSDYTDQVEKFYELSGDSLWWVKGLEPTSQARQMVTLLERADEKGLSADDYDGGRWSARLAKLKPRTRSPRDVDAAAFDLALTVSTMRYVSDLHNGKVSPNRLAFAFDVQSKKYDLPEFLKDHVASADDVAATLAQVEPPYPGYRQAVQALQRYLRLAKQDDGAPLPPPTSASKKAVTSGDVYPGVPRLVHLLRLLGDLPADVNFPADRAVYDGALVEAVRSFQRRHGRDPNGRIDRQTLADLNVPLADRVQQMRLTLERWRWLPADYQTPLIVVNIPEFCLRAYDKDFKVAIGMKVVVGNSYGHDTPVFHSTMTYIIFRPYWHVPRSIVKNELIPHLRKDPEYLKKGDFEITDGQESVVKPEAITDDILRELSAGRLFIRQRPGPANALGLVAFMFSNSYNVYMHDTPVRELFADSRRDFSHGCIRLENAFDLAEWVLRGNPGWTPDRIRAAMNDVAPQNVDLVHPIPVGILYATVVVSEDEVVQFYDDIYGHDAALQRALAKGYPYPQ